MTQYRTLDGGDFAGKRVLVRVDLNVPMANGSVTDDTRIRAVLPTISDLTALGAKVILLSHLGRPGGTPKQELSLATVAHDLSKALDAPVAFATDCVGPEAADVIASMADGDIALLENTRFHRGEEANDTFLTAELAALGDVYVNDAFATAHRAHASTAGLANHLTAYAGRCMEAELKALDQALANPERPLISVVGGAKISSKLALLSNLAAKADTIIIGGAMANTFLAADGIAVGASLHEPDLLDTARQVRADAAAKDCEIILPVDVTVAGKFEANAPHRTIKLSEITDGEMIVDIGPDTITMLKTKIDATRTIVWNGPFGAFELEPFDAGTNAIARHVAAATKSGKLVSIAGGGDTVAALNRAGVSGDFTYVSTAGGAFLEWLEGKTLPGVDVLIEKR
ncbi:MAG: phosphoglycerate kinase [Pseudomonadota bacterium]